MKYRSLTSKDFKPKGELLFDYLSSADYASDLLEGRGVCLSGNSGVRADLFVMMAKACAISGRSTVLISLHSLVPTIENNEERRAFIQRADFVFVEWFQREFKNDSNPYTYSQISDVEDFLITRMRGGKPTFFSACHTWDRLTWWSGDFLKAMRDNVRDIVIGV